MAQLRSLWIALVILGALAASNSLCRAQEYRGQITGIVTDPTNAVVPDAELIVTNISTGVQFRTKSTSAGAYSFSLLQPSTYRVQVEKAGFKTAICADIIVETGAKVGLNVRLEVGTVTQTVEVTVATPLLSTETADWRTVVDLSAIDNLPMSGRSPFALARLAPGVVVAGFINETEPYDVGGNSYVSIGGTRRYATEFAVNGVPDESPGGMYSGFEAYTPPVDATQEYEVQTNAMEAQYGHNGSGYISLTTKSGTNQYHGTLSEYVQNDVLNATNFFTNRTGGRKPPRRYNQYGGTIGGPFSIPKVFNGKDRAFFFFSYDGIRNDIPTATYASVPTAAMRAGDLSALSTTIYNPFSATATGGVYTRSPVSTGSPANQIPSTLLNPIAMNMLKYVPLPNTGAPGLLQNNYFRNVQATNKYANYLGRFDLNISQKNRIFFSWGQSNLISSTGDTFNTLATGSGNNWPMYTVAFDDTYAASPVLVFDFRLGYTRYSQDYLPKSIGFNPAQLGFPASYASSLSEAAFPAVSFTYFTGFGVGSLVTDYLEHDQYDYVSFGSTYVHGAHTLKFGWEGHEQENNIFTRGNSSGGYTFGGNYTAGPGLSAAPALGSDFAEFLMGVPDSGSVDTNVAEEIYGYYFAWYAQDDWKVTPHLTLNMGLRYDFETPGTEKRNRDIVGWSDGPNPIASAAIANYAAHPDASLPAQDFQANGGVLFAGVNGEPTGMWNQDYGRIQPRLGLAWNPDFWQRRIAVRAGAGISYFTLDPPSETTEQQGFNITTPMVISTNNGQTISATLSNPFPNGLQKAPGSSLGTETYLGNAVIRLDRTTHALRTNKVEFSVQAQLTHSDLVEATYTSNVQNHAKESLPLNFVPPQFLGTSRTRDTTAINYLTATVTNPFQGLIPSTTTLGGATISRAQLLYNYPQFTTVGYLDDYSASETFNGVNFAWRRRMSHGLSVLSNYEISKQLFGSTRQNQGQPFHWDRIHGSEDFPQQLTLSATWQLPFGRSRAFFPGVNKFVSGFISGWNANGIYFAQRGAPLSWGPLVFTGNTWNDIKNVPGGHSINEWFNTSAFDRVSGDQPNTSYELRYFPFNIPYPRAPGSNQMNFSLVKETHINERTNLAISAEAFDIFNHPNWSTPNLTPTSSAFGTITAQGNLPRAVQLGVHLSF